MEFDKQRVRGYLGIHLGTILIGLGMVFSITTTSQDEISIFDLSISLVTAILGILLLYFGLRYFDGSFIRQRSEDPSDIQLIKVVQVALVLEDNFRQIGRLLLIVSAFMAGFVVRAWYLFIADGESVESFSLTLVVSIIYGFMMTYMLRIRSNGIKLTAYTQPLDEVLIE